MRHYKLDLTVRAFDFFSESVPRAFIGHMHARLSKLDYHWCGRYNLLVWLIHWVPPCGEFYHA